MKMRHSAMVLCSVGAIACGARTGLEGWATEGDAGAPPMDASLDAPGPATGGSSPGAPDASPDACALLAGGTVACWGDNIEGQLGNGTTMPSSSTPVAVPGLTDVTAVSASGFHACALIADGSVA